MMIEVVSELASQMTLASPVYAVSNPCAEAPTGVDTYVTQVVGWIKYGVLWALIGSGFVSVAAMVVGKFAQMGRVAQIGASGLFWSIVGAIGYVVIYGILTGITGTGC